MKRDLGPALKKLREKQQLTQIDAAVGIGIARSTLAGIEAGVKPPGRITLEKLARFYCTTIDNLYTVASPQPGEFVENQDELALLRFWRSLDDAGQKLVLLSLSRGRNG